MTQSEKHGWQPIETAPKDGTGVLLVLEYGTDSYRYVGRWHSELKCWSRDETSSALFPAHMQGWFTHWMPLPEPPLREAQP